jgi:hypothetical protein
METPLDLCNSRLTKFVKEQSNCKNIIETRTECLLEGLKDLRDEGGGGAVMLRSMRSRYAGVWISTDSLVGTYIADCMYSELRLAPDLPVVTTTSVGKGLYSKSDVTTCTKEGNN